MEQPLYPRPKSALVVLFLFMSFLMGILGTLFTISALNTNPTVRTFIENLNTNTASGPARQERIILEESSAVIDTAKKISPAVVSITTSRNIRDFFGNVFAQTGGGSGFIITSDGMILTNKHVVEDTKTEYTVITSDGKNYIGQVLALDPVLDLAIVKIEASGLPVADLGNSDDLQIGQFVVAVGNALAEFQNTVTVGVISAKDRQITAAGNGSTEQLDGLLQTDAAINPGNSGGPLVNLRGQVIGINTAIAGDGQNIGFAIPINGVKLVVESFKKNGKIVRPMLGIRHLPITKEIAALEKLSVDHGALIIRGDQLGQPAVLPGSPADKAGLQENDIIIAINGEEITEQKSLVRILQRYLVGDEVEITYMRKEKQQKVKVKLEASS